MKLLTSTALALLLVQNIPPLPQQSQVPMASIEGIVLRADNGDAIAKAQVTLSRQIAPPAPGQNPTTPVTPPPPIPPMMTDASGKFLFKDLEPGTYRLFATKSGFVRFDYGARTTGGTGAQFNLAAGQLMKDISFRLVNTGVVSGRVRTSSGEPGAALNIQLMKTAYNVQGQRTFQSVSSGRSDDRGDYRLFWVTPGRYYVAIGGNSLTTLTSSDGGTILFLNSGGDAASTNIATVYYPGTTDPLRAATIEVGPGGEVPGIDFVLPDQQVYRVRGRLADASSGLPPRSASISLVPRDISFSGLSGNIPPNYNASTGTFDMRNVPPGAYWLRAQAADSTATAVITPNAVGRTVSEALSMATSARTAAQKSLDVTGDMEGILLELGPGFSINGSVRVEGTALPTSNGPRVALRPTNPNGLASSLLPLNADGTFTLTNVMPGEYRAQILGMPVDYYVKEAQIEQTDVLNAPLVITEPVRGNLEIVVSSAAGQIDGTLTDKGFQPVSALQTVLIPDEHRDRSDLFKSAVTDQSGKFTFRGVTPGNYKIFAWESLEPNAFYDPQILRQYEDQGKQVRVLEGGKTTAEVKMIPARQ
jgi:hypothetical protein